MWQLPENSSKYLYQQIVDLIKSLIDKGQLQEDQTLPSERKLAQYLQVNRSTVVRALDELSDQGYLREKMGSGRFIKGNKIRRTPLLFLQNKSHHIWKPQKDNYQLQADFYRKKTNCLDLSNGDLPLSLSNHQTLTDYSWQHLLENHPQYDESLGIQSLRQTVQQYLHHQHGLNTDYDNILITSGAQQALFLIIQGLLNPGDAIASDAPSYFYSLPIFQSMGLRLYGVVMDDSGISIDGLARLMRKQKIKMLFLNPIFQNPTGNVMTTERKKALLDFCQQENLPIVEDDAYSALSFDEHLETRPLKYYDQDQQVIYIGSLSKYLGKNIRCGWLIAPENLIQKFADIRQHIDSGLSVLPQLLAQNYLSEQASYQQRQLSQKLQRKAAQLTDWLSKTFSNDLSFPQVQGGYHLYAKAKNQQIADQILKSLLFDYHIIVARGGLFGDSNQQMRLSFAHFNLDHLTKEEDSNADTIHD